MEYPKGAARDPLSDGPVSIPPGTPGIRSHFADVRGTRIHWADVEGPDGPPFLLLHGWGGSVLKWTAAMPHLARYRRTIALDLPGFGRSDGARGSHSPGWFAGAARAFMDEIGVERAIVVGNSLGGLIAIAMAATWPERCEGVVLAAPALPSEGDAPRPPPSFLASLLVPAVPVLGDLVVDLYMRRPVEQLVAESLRRNFADPSRVPPEMVRALEDEMRERSRRPDHRRATVLAGRRMLWELTGRREMLWRTMRGLRTPVLFLWGDKDQLMPVNIGYRAVERIPGAQLVVLDGCGHQPQVEHPDRFAAAVIAFARALTAREAR
jgi:pimeloyl-ACP methyl ester carboxylesterase